MPAILLLLTLSLSARAGVAVSAEAGADATVPRISLQTTLSPLSGPALGATLTPGLNASLAAPSALTPALAAPILAAPSALTAQALPAPLALSVVPQASPARAALAAAAAPETPTTDPAPAASPADKAEPGAPSFKTRILGMLKSMANPFGGKKAEELPAPNESVRLDREFAKIDFWGRIAPGARAEIEGLRARKLSKAELKAYVQAEADAAIERIKAARGVANIGFHYNLHGGRREEYVGVGIRATMGDIALRYSMHGDTNYKVYFFQSGEHAGFTPLDSTHGESLFVKMRMGYALNLFNLDAPALSAARADGRIKNFGTISMDFHGMGGVPYESYLAPPVDVFTKTARKIGLSKLSWDEETLATVRYLEAAATDGGAYVPGGAPASAEASAKGAAARARAAAAASASHRIAPQFKLVDDSSFYYHGTTMDDLARVVESGGEMAPDVSQFSLRPRDSVEYAADRRRRLGREDNPEVLLQFRRDELSPFVSGDLFKAALAVTDRGMPPIHAAYSAATKPVTLALMTPESKTTLLAWLRVRAESGPNPAKWAALLARFETVLAPR